MNKKRYIKPDVDVLGLTAEAAFMDYSYDNTGNNGADGEKGKIIEDDLDDGDEVGAKRNYYDWDYDYEEYDY